MELSKASILNLIKDCCKKCSWRELDIQVEWHDALHGSVIGQALYSFVNRISEVCVIRFSLESFTQLDEESQYLAIVHEICHIIAWSKYGKFIQPHGKEWKKVMRQCGIKNPQAYYYGKELKI